MPDAQRDAGRDAAALSATSRPRFERREIAVMVLAVAVAAVALYVCALASEAWRTHSPLSAIKAADVVSIQLRQPVRLLDGRYCNSVVFHVLEHKLIPDFLAALAPTHRDGDPEEWQELGMLDFDLKDGSRVSVHLYDTQHDFAAFSIDKQYYRAGSMGDVKRLLRLPTTGTHNGDGTNDIRH